MPFLRAPALLSAVVLLLCLCGCSGPVDVVRQAHIQPDVTSSVAEALERYPYFTKVTWDAYEDKDGRHIVEAACDIDVSANCNDVDRPSLEVAKRDTKRDYFLARFLVEGFPRQVRALEAVHVTECADGKRLTFADPKYLRAIYNRERVRFFCFEGLNCPACPQQ